MDNFKRAPRRAPRQAIDGFLSAPGRSQGGRRPIGEDAFRAAKVNPNAGRRPDNFDHPEGYNAAYGPVQTPGQRAKRTDLAARQSLLNMSMPPEPDFTPKKAKKQAKKHRVRRWILRTSLAVFILLFLSGGLVVAKAYLNAHKVLKGGGKAVALQKTVDPNLLKGEGDGRINILLLGIGGDGHDGPDLTDTILIASIDPVNHKVALLSVPRDLWVSVPGGGSMKLNAVYETGKYKYLGKMSDSNSDTKAVEAGFALDDQVLEQVLGIPIHYHVLVNFKAFQQAVNTVGGVTVNVPTQLYDPTMAWENGGSPILAQPGVQTFDGLHALYYVRSRETSSDFARAQRQRAVIVALEQKVLSLGTLSDPVKITQLLDAFGSNVVSDFSMSDMTRLYAITKNIDPASTQSVGLTDSPNNFVRTGMIGNQSVVVPTAGLGDYDAIQSYVRNTLKDGYLAKENAIVMVLNGTTNTTLGTTQTDTLKSYGYNVGTVGNAPTSNYQHTVLVDLAHGKDPYTQHYLEERFGVKATQKLPDQAIHPGNAQFMLILGEDEATHS
jgi:LCP family protein required for cell wall assembly